MPLLRPRAVNETACKVTDLQIRKLRKKNGRHVGKTKLEWATRSYEKKEERNRSR